MIVIARTVMSWSSSPPVLLVSSPSGLSLTADVDESAEELSAVHIQGCYTPRKSSLPWSFLLLTPATDGHFSNPIYWKVISVDTFI